MPGTSYHDTVFVELDLNSGTHTQEHPPPLQEHQLGYHKGRHGRSKPDDHNNSIKQLRHQPYF